MPSNLNSTSQTSVADTALALSARAVSYLSSQGNENASTDNDDDNESIEEPCDIMYGYVPTDEKRLCKFFVKYGHCWKSLCTKEHERTIPCKLFLFL